METDLKSAVRELNTRTLERERGREREREREKR
jgi:hypothetical protein